MFFAGSLSLGGVWAWNNGLVTRTLDQFRASIADVSKKMGFKVQEILVMGRGQTGRKELLEAVRLERGAPILTFDMEAAKRRIENLPWVQTATVERILPETVFVRITERTPMALWQNRGKFALIDNNGTVILKNEIGQFTDLLQVVGEAAPKHAAALLLTLSTQPELMTRVKAAVWVGDRRWNIVLNNGINIRLPEDGAATAWARLAEYERTHKVLGRNVKVLDMRLPDRLIVRKEPKTAVRKKATGRET